MDNTLSDVNICVRNLNTDKDIWISMDSLDFETIWNKHTREDDWEIVDYEGIDLTGVGLDTLLLFNEWYQKNPNQYEVVSLLYLFNDKEMI